MTIVTRTSHKQIEVLIKQIGLNMSRDMFNTLEKMSSDAHRSRSRFVRGLIFEKAKQLGYEITDTMIAESG